MFTTTTLVYEGHLSTASLTFEISAPLTIHRLLVGAKVEAARLGGSVFSIQVVGAHWTEFVKVYGLPAPSAC